jgi:hypothetical protein
VSDIIYDNGNIIRRELIENKIGPENTSHLLAFAKEPVITLEDVLSGNYDKKDIPGGQTLRLAIALGLRHADEKQVGKVREFIGENLGHENLAIFDSVWAGKIDERALQITQMTNFLNKNKGR